MTIVVCLKRVPDTEARVRPTPDGQGVDLGGAKHVLNPYDEYALEAALRLKEARGEGEVVAVSLGPAEAAETLRTALAMGADRAVLLRTDAPVEGLAAARLLADQVRALAPQLVLTGLKAVDDDLQAVGSMLAALLDWPGAAAVAEFALEDGRVVAQREVEGAVEVVELPLPCVLTITKGSFEPRYPSLKGIMAAKKKPLDEVPVQPPTPAWTRERFDAPPERQAGRILGHGPEAVPELVRVLREEVKIL